MYIWCERTYYLYIYDFDARVPRYFSFRVGSSLYQSGGHRVAAKRLIVHKEYNKVSVSHDCMLFELEKPLEFTEFIGFVQLPKYGDFLRPNTLMALTGWGKLFKVK